MNQFSLELKKISVIGGNPPLKPLPTSKLQIAKLRLHVYQMRASSLGNLKLAMEYIFDLLETINDP